MSIKYDKKIKKKVYSNDDCVKFYKKKRIFKAHDSNYATLEVSELILKFKKNMLDLDSWALLSFVYRNQCTISTL